MIAAQRVHGLLTALCGFAFFVWARLRPDAMTVETYGYAAYDTDAEIWAFAYVAAGLLVMLGAAVDRVWRHAVWPRIAGLALLVIMSVILAFSAWGAPNGSQNVIFSALYFAPLSAFYIAANLAILAGARHGAD